MKTCRLTNRTVIFAAYNPYAWLGIHTHFEHHSMDVVLNVASIEFGFEHVWRRDRRDYGFMVQRPLTQRAVILLGLASMTLLLILAALRK